MEFRHLRFSRAAGTYNLHSQVQQRMADTLVSLLPKESEFTRALEIGAGTGHLTRNLLGKYPRMDLDITDVSEPMVLANRKSLALEPKGKMPRWYVLDAAGSRDEATAADPETFDLIASNALVQWFPDLPLHLHWVARRLKQEGCYLVSGLLGDNFSELQSILRSAPFHYENWPGQNREEIETSAQTAGLAVKVFAEDSWEETYKTPEDLLRRIQGVGASLRPSEGHFLTRERLKELCRRYVEGFSIAGPGVKATWKPWFALLQKTG